MSTESLIILAVGALVAANCALVGSFLVLRKMSLIGDAISHAVLPGIALAFLITGSRAALPMVVGAGAFGVLTVALVEFVHRSRRVSEDASIGVVFPALFAVGVILISRFATDIDLDVDCVLFGEIALAPWDEITLFGQTFRYKAIWTGLGVLALNLALVIGLYKELKLGTFDPELAESLGFSPRLVHYALMTAVSVTIVSAFESVGAILVVAMLIVPAAAAYLLTDRLWVMLVLAVVIGQAASAGGYALATWWDLSIAGCMAAAAGAIFVLAWIASPGHGLIARQVGHARLASRLSRRLILHELTALPNGADEDDLRRRFGWSAARWGRAVAALERRAFVERRDGRLAATAAGREAIGAGN